MGQTHGCSKRKKGSQPKRARYNAEWFRRRVRELELHLKKHPDDTQAQTALVLARDMVEKGGK